MALRRSTSAAAGSNGVADYYSPTMLRSALGAGINGVSGHHLLPPHDAAATTAIAPSPAQSNGSLHSLHQPPSRLQSEVSTILASNTAASLSAPAPAASLIVSWAVAGKRILVVGGDATAASRIRYALEADASVTLVCPSQGLSDPVRALLADVDWHNRSFARPDLDGKAMAFVCLEDAPMLAREIGLLCLSRAVPVNVSTASDVSSFFFMSTYRDKSVQVAVSTNGHGPRLASKLRRIIAQSLPPSAGACLEKLSMLRQKLRSADPQAASAGRRVDFVNRISEAWSIEAVADLSPREIEALVNAYLKDSDSNSLPVLRPGILRVVAAASADPDDLTRRAFKAISEAGLVLADFDAPTGVLDVASGDVLVLPESDDEDALEEADRALSEILASGRDAVRLVSSTLSQKEFSLYSSRGYDIRLLPSVGTSDLIKSSISDYAAPALPVHADPTTETRTVIKELAGPSHDLSFVNGDEAASHVAFALTDMSFVYKGNDESPLGDGLVHWAAEGRQNAFGRRHTSKVVSTLSGAGSIFHGAAATGSAVTVVATSSAVPAMVPELYQIAAAHLPVVLHVSSVGVSSKDLSISPLYADVMVAAYSGFAIMTSASVQEAQDLSIVAHIVATAASHPVIHAFDGYRVASEKQNVRLLGGERIASAYSSAVAAASAVKSTALADLTQTVMSHLSGVLGRQYHVFDYYGHSSPEVVFVAFGPAAELAKEAVEHLHGAGNRVGVLNVRLLRPWSSHHFLAALPKGVRSVIVIDQTTKPGSGCHGALYRDVAAAFHESFWTARVPVVVAGGFSDGAEHQHPSGLVHVAHSALVGDLRSGFVVERVATLPSPPRAADEKGLDAVFWDRDADSTALAVAGVAAYLVPREPAVHKYKLRAAAQVEPVASTHISVGRTGFNDRSFVGTADYVAVHSVALLSDFDVAAALREGGTLLINRPGTTMAAFRSGLLAEDLGRELSAGLRAALARKHARLAVIDADKLASEFTLFRGRKEDYASLVLQAAFHLLTDPAGANSAWFRTLTERLHTAGEKDPNIVHTKNLAAASACANVLVVPLPSEWLHVEVEPSHALPATPAATVELGKREFSDAEDGDDEPTGHLTKRHHAAWPVVFKEAFGLQSQLRPDEADRTFTVRVTENRRLTPESYERNVFHMEFDIAGTGLKYEVGEALGVHGHNDSEEVAEFIKWYGLEADQVVAYRRREDGRSGDVIEYRTVEQLLTQVVDIFGRPGRKFYQFLVGHASDAAEREQLGLLGSGDGAAELERRAEEESPSFADVLREFPSARPCTEALLSALPAIKARHYSIASAMSVHPRSVHLLVVSVDWTTKSGLPRYGQCTRYLQKLQPGTAVTVSVRPSVMRLPTAAGAPVVMAGLGTGMAPFRAFVEERAFQRRSRGQAVGPMALYFGSRRRAEEYLYGEEMEAYHGDGLLTLLRPAFSRDQARKVYIQHRIREDGAWLAEMLLDRGGAFYLCGPTWPVADVRDALLDAFVARGLTYKEAEDTLERLKQEERYVLEVY
ncbi:hypothetical protein HK405_003330 [Cladochytrium tenue]|nr:hypothetical protein HK405_003330 [Cladochytrium tenue]